MKRYITIILASTMFLLGGIIESSAKKGTPVEVCVGTVDTPEFMRMSARAKFLEQHTSTMPNEHTQKRATISYVGTVSHTRKVGFRQSYETT